ncbi:predicted protein, partial [Nematostella vectensis]
MENGSIYHEKQNHMLCAVHALNNLFQDPNAFSKKSLDDICYLLDPNSTINAHKNPLGLGNYDVNVVMAAVNQKGCEAVWFDRRMNPDCLDLDNIFGFIINTPSGMNIAGIGLPIKRPHWYGVRKIETCYYNLDSKLPCPKDLGDNNQMIHFL